MSPLNTPTLGGRPWMRRFIPELHQGWARADLRSALSAMPPERYFMRQPTPFLPSFFRLKERYVRLYLLTARIAAELTDADPRSAQRPAPSGLSALPWLLPRNPKEQTAPILGKRGLWRFGHRVRRGPPRADCPLCPGY